MLVGDFIRLEPVDRSHIPGLYAAIGHRSVFEFGFGGGLSALPETLEVFERWESGYHRPENNAFAVVLVGGPRDGTVEGTTTLGDENARAELFKKGTTATLSAAHTASTRLTASASRGDRTASGALSRRPERKRARSA